MHSQLITLVAVAILLAICATASTTITSQNSLFNDRQLVAKQNTEIAKRLLGTYITAKAHDEERGIPGLDKLTSKIEEAYNLKMWLRQNKNVEDVFDLLKLNEGVDRAIFSPKLKTMSKYVDMFNHKYPDNQKSLLKMLRTLYHEDDIAAALASMEHSKRARGTVKELETQMLQSWLDDKKSVHEIFSLLKLKNDDASAMVSPNLATLSQYINLSNTKKSPAAN